MGETESTVVWILVLKEDTCDNQIHGSAMIKERHRHRYEYNNKYKSDLEAAGMVSSGINPETGLVEIIEIKDHPWFVGVQYHPEYKSTVASPHPLFIAFIGASVKFSKEKNSANVAHNQ